jgi:hypothetical protein
MANPNMPRRSALVASAKVEVAVGIYRKIPERFKLARPGIHCQAFCAGPEVGRQEVDHAA